MSKAPTTSSDTIALRAALTAALSRVLAETYTLYLKTQNFHWNVTGPSFHALHTMFGEQYQEMAPAIDELAERIRALGSPAPGSYREFAALSGIEEAGGRPDATDMVRLLAGDHEQVVETLARAVTTAEAAGDVPTADMLIARIQTHQKHAWMLNSTLA